MCPSMYVTFPPARLLLSLILTSLRGRLAAYGSACAEIGVTVAGPLPRSITKTRTTATTTITPAAIASGIQFRSRGSVGGTSCGPVLTSGFYTLQAANFIETRHSHARFRRDTLTARMIFVSHESPGWIHYRFWRDYAQICHRTRNSRSREALSRRAPGHLSNVLRSPSQA